MIQRALTLAGVIEHVRVVSDFCPGCGAPLQRAHRTAFFDGITWTSSEKEMARCTSITHTDGQRMFVLRDGFWE